MVNISEKPIVASFPIEIQGCIVNGLFDAGAAVSCISYDFYRKFIIKPEIKSNIHAKVDLADGSNPGPLGIVLCSIKLGSHIFQHHVYI